MSDDNLHEAELLDMLEERYGVRPLRATWHDGYWNDAIPSWWIPPRVDMEFAEPVTLETGLGTGLGTSRKWTVPTGMDEGDTLDSTLAAWRLMRSLRAARDADAEDAKR